MLPLMYEGVVDFGRDIDPSNLPVQLARSLCQVDASSVSVEDNRVSFTGGMFRLVSRRNVLGPFGFGDLTVDSSKRQIRYRLSLRQLITSDTAGCGCALIFLFIARAPMPPVLVFILLAWVSDRRKTRDRDSAFRETYPRVRPRGSHR